MIPPLADFLRWLSQLPPAFQAEPRLLKTEGLPVNAVVADLFESMTGRRPAAEDLKPFIARDASPVERNRLRWVLAACHLLWHPAMRGEPRTREQIARLLVQDLSALASVAAADGVLTDEERREELVRRALRALELRLPGESQREAEDRLGQVDSVVRHRLAMESAEKERRARKAREAEARKRAEEEAASKAYRE